MFIYIINFLMWLATFAMIVVAVYIHYFAVGVADRNVAGPVIGAIILGCWSANLTHSIWQRNNRHDTEESE